MLRKRRYDAVHRGGAAERSQHAKGKLTARERIDRLLDPGSFTELDMFALHRTTSFDMGERRIRGDGVITGWGTIDGRQVFVFSHDASVFGGSLGEVFAEKVTKVMDLALRTGCPVHRHQRLRRRAHPGGRCLAGRLRRDLLSQRRGKRCRSRSSR